jgi:hypothetical protein
MEIRNQEDFWSGAMFTVIGLGFAAVAQRYDMGAIRSMGPGWFPTAVGLGMAVLGAALSLKALKAGALVRIGAFGWRGIAALLGSLALFSVLLPYLGMVVALSLLVFGSSLANRDFKLLEALIVTAALVVMGWLIFIVGLGIQVQVWPIFPGN